MLSSFNTSSTQPQWSRALKLCLAFAIANLLMLNPALSQPVPRGTTHLAQNKTAASGQRPAAKKVFGNY